MSLKAGKLTQKVQDFNKNQTLQPTYDRFTFEKEKYLNNVTKHSHLYRQSLFYVGVGY